MSLRVRLVLLIVVVVALAAGALSAVELETLIDSLTSDAIKYSSVAAQQVSLLLRDHIELLSESNPAPQSVEETKALWNQIVSDDAQLRRLLVQMMASSSSLLEINVAGETGLILASSNDRAVNTPVERRENFEIWRKNSWLRRTRDLLTRRPDWEVTVSLGAGDLDKPIFTIQVVTSSLFLRKALMDQIRLMALVSGGAIGLSLLLTILATTGALRPVKRIEDSIDRIAQGRVGGEEPGGGRDLDDGTAKEFRVVQSKLNLLGQQYRGAREDATELRHNVDQLLERMASQLDVATRLAAISRLTGGVAHEIKNPLNAIALRLELLRARLGEPDHELSGEIDILSKEVLRLDRVVKTFLDFSRPLDVHLQEIDLGTLTREVTEFVTPQARLAKIEVDFSAPSEPALMRGDSDLLKQAVLNLVTNAIDAMHDGGKLQVRVEQSGDKLTLEVSDTGPGIPLELRDKVFQLYFTTKTGGSGIGLAMTYRAVQLHNGTISFTSEAGSGTTFRPLSSRQLYGMPDLLQPRAGQRIPKTAVTTLWLAGAVGLSSCGVHKAPRAFSPPPVTAKAPPPVPPLPEIAAPEQVAFEPVVYDFPSQTDPSSRFPALPPPRAPRPVANVPKPLPSPSENIPAPALRLSQILTPEETRRNTQELDQHTENVKGILTKVKGKILTPEQKDIAERVQTYLSQAEQAREQDLLTAVNLARRADLLAKDLLDRLP